MTSQYTLEKKPVETLMQSLWQFRGAHDHFPTMLTFSSAAFERVRKHPLVLARVKYVVDDDLSDGVSTSILEVMLAPPGSNGSFSVSVVESLPNDAKYVLGDLPDENVIYQAPQ
jgi:hypothetical protein